MKENYRFYRGCYRIVRALVGVVYWLRVTGRENVPEGAAIVCANHSSMIDPFLIAFAFGIDCHMHIVAKVELFRIPVLSPILKKLGMISVDRDISDVTTIRNVLTYLKNGEKVLIFPEGTRTSEDDAISAKSGAVKIAERTKVPLIPVYLPRKKPLFSKVPIVIGETYTVENLSCRRSAEDYLKLAGVLMGKIKALNPLFRTGGGLV